MKILRMLFFAVAMASGLQGMENQGSGLPSGIRFVLPSNFGTLPEQEKKAHIGFVVSMNSAINKGEDHPETVRLMQLFVAADALIVPKKPTPTGQPSLDKLIGTGFFQR
jgi:hypothetical protein